MPLEGEEPVEQPQINPLESMKPEMALLGCEPAKKSDVDVIVVAVNVWIRVMNGIVLPVPQIGTAPHQIECQCHHLVDPTPFRVGAMATVVLDIEADRRQCQSEDNR